MKNNKDKKLTDEYFASTKALFDSKEISETVFTKCMLQVACEYLTEFADEESALVALHEVSELALKHLVPMEMETDSFFAADMVSLAHHLERLGITNEIKYIATQPGVGRA